MKKIKAAGVEIIEIADKKPFQDAVKPVWDKYGAKYADAGQAHPGRQVSTDRASGRPDPRGPAGRSALGARGHE